MIVSVAPVTAPVAAKLAAVAAPKAVSVPVVNVLPVIPVAELSRPTLAAPVMLSELPDTAPVDDSVAPATVPVAVSAAQEMAPEASTPVVNTSVQFTSLHSSWSQPTLPCAVSPSSGEGQRVRQQVRHRDRLSLEGGGPDLHAALPIHEPLMNHPVPLLTQTCQEPSPPETGTCRTYGQYGLALSSLDNDTSHVSKRWRSWHCCRPPIAILVVGTTRSACLQALITRQRKRALTSCSRLPGRCSQPSGACATCCCSPHMFQAGTMMGRRPKQRSVCPIQPSPRESRALH